MSGEAPRTGALSYSRTRGSTEPLLLVHGGWEDRGAWDPLLPLLSTGFDVVACDRRGHGERAGEEKAGSAAQDAGDLAALVEAIDLFPLHVAAHGSAAASVLRLAAERPELVRSVLVHEPPFFGLLGEFREDGATIAGVTGAVHEGQRRVRGGDPAGGAQAYLAVFGSLEESWDRFPREARSRWQRNASAWAQESDASDVFTVPASVLAEIGTPTLVTVGERSPEFGQRIGQALVRLLPNASLAGVPASGHLPQIFHPNTLTGIWASYLLERSVPPT